MKIRTLSALVLVSVPWAIAGCSTAPKSDQDRQALSSETRGTLDSMEAIDPTLRQLRSQSVGYAVFPNIGKAGFIGGGAYGRGEVFERGRMVGYADITQGTVGLQAGAQSYDELIVFLTQDQLDRFKRNQFAFSGNLSAVALSAGAAGAADHSKGVVVFIRSRGGLMAEASVGGQQFTFQPVGSDGQPYNNNSSGYNSNNNYNNSSSNYNNSSGSTWSNDGTRPRPNPYDQTMPGSNQPSSNPNATGNYRPY